MTDHWYSTTDDRWWSWCEDDKKWHKMNKEKKEDNEMETYVMHHISVLDRKKIGRISYPS